ncbi:MAG: radical SAM protein [Bacteroidetes bacterium 4484_249]|nr:MAG: radical SAM protein [Bacteroidetes bacterium 4484_249]
MTTETITKQIKFSKNTEDQINILESSYDYIPSFNSKLSDIGLYPLKPVETEILQINVGYMCNQTCKHCHVDASPLRTEIMTRETMRFCLDALDKSKIDTVDLTGGAPEMNPNFKWFITKLREKYTGEIIVRSNLTILQEPGYEDYPDFFKENKLTVIASLPCYTKRNTDKQRGNGVFNKSIESLKKLNYLGYGKGETALKIHLVYNPGGASLPGSQHKLESDYKKILSEDYGIVFNKLFTITNLPINRFLNYLLKVDKYEEYMTVLSDAFNPSAAMGVMCRNTISVGWNGVLYDCDFNQILKLELSGNAPRHIKDYNSDKLLNREIVTNQHCFGCTAGEGSSCQGAII